MKSFSARTWIVFQYDQDKHTWTASSEFGTYRLCEQRRFRRACASAQSRQNLRCSLKQAVSQEEPSDRKPDPWPLWMAGHMQLKFVMTECSKTQIRLTGPTLPSNHLPDVSFEAQFYLQLVAVELDTLVSCSCSLLWHCNYLLGKKDLAFSLFRNISNSKHTSSVCFTV